MKTRKLQTALVTGATSGIGLELARLFAKDGFNLVLVARDELTLGRVADETRTLGAQAVTVIAKDLSYPRAGEELFLDTSQMGIEVDILVNDAGVAHRRKFADSDLENDLEIVYLNIVSLMSLTKLYLKGMLERGGGKILQVASVASYLPTPLLAVYGASKAFVLSFTDSLINELKDTPVTVTALIPGPTRTEFFIHAGMEDSKAATEDPEDPAKVALIGYQALMAGQHHAAAPGVTREIVMSGLLPNSYLAAQARRQVERTGRKQKP
jgi:uncharacterized protein